MKIKTWLSLILIIIIVGGWYTFFYKMYDNTAIAASADKVLAVDVKKNTNTLITYFVTHPSTWNLSSIFNTKSKTDTTFNWKETINIPDYFFIFHSKGQPENIYYTVLSIKNETAFQQALIAGSFEKEKNDTTEYFSAILGISISKNDKQLLISNVVSDKNLLHTVADELFIKKQYLSSSTIDKIIAPPNDFSIYLTQNNFIAKDVIANGNFTNGHLIITTDLQPAAQYTFDENTFNISTTSLLNLDFAQPSKSVYALIPDSLRSVISTAINLNIDSFFLPQNKTYKLNIACIKKRTDSAISYTYDDNFNKVEKVITNVVEEPSFNCSVLTSDPLMLFNYLKRNKSIEQDSIGNLFVAFPFVKTYATINKSNFFLKANNYDSVVSDKQISCIAYFNINGDRLPTTAINYLPDYVLKMAGSVRSINCIIKKDNDKILARLEVISKDTSKPFLLSFN